LDRALALLARGFSVIPVPLPRPGVPKNTPGDGKTPAIKWGEYRQRHPTEAEIRAWFATEQNIGIITGAISDLVVVDADSIDGLKYCTRHLKYTPWQTQTPRTDKSYHLYFRHPGVPVGNRAKLQTANGRIDVDVRGDGGFVIAAGSRHMNGREYREAGHWTAPRAEVPRFWPGWLARPTPISAPASPRTSRPAGALPDRARRYLASIPRPEIGQGSDAAVLYAACRLVRGFDLTDADAINLLWDWAGGRPGWTREWISQKVAHAHKYGTEPIGALR
jgi:hypothetical protein